MNPFYEAWFFWAGVVFTGIIFLGIAWLVTFLLLWPIIESISLTRCSVKCFGADRTQSIGGIWWTAFKETVGGRNWDTLSNKYFVWEGVGQWYKLENKDESA